MKAAPRHVVGAAFLLFCLTRVASAPSEAAEQPLWELGAGVGALGFSAYRGAQSSSVYPVPVPYVVYRGKYVQADRDGVRSVLLRQEHVELNFSVSATTPVQGDDSAARAGMPDLDAALEIGPALNVHLWRDDASNVRADLRVPVRGAVTASAHPQWIGWQVLPQLALDWKDPAGLTGWNAGLLAGPILADRRYAGYFYDVEAQYATATRPAFRAHGGYAGSQVTLSTSRRFARSWFGAFVRYDRLEGAAFVRSPLVQQHGAWMAGFGYVWIIAESAVRVNVPD